MVDQPSKTPTLSEATREANRRAALADVEKAPPLKPWQIEILRPIFRQCRTRRPDAP